MGIFRSSRKEPQKARVRVSVTPPQPNPGQHAYVPAGSPQRAALPKSREPVRPAGEYVPKGGSRDRFRGTDGGLTLRLVTRRSRHGIDELYLVENTTGLLVDNTDARVTALGIYAGRFRGQDNYQAAGRAGNFQAGAELTLLRQPNNTHDGNAVGIAAVGSFEVAGYVGKAHARALAKRLDEGASYRAISMRGTPAGQPAVLVMGYLAAPDGVMEQLTRPRREA